MHPHAAPLIDLVPEQHRAKFKVFFDAFDTMDRENTHLRLKLQENGNCPYGHFGKGGCALGYPGCACMDDLMQMQTWSPEDEAKANVRLGKVLMAHKVSLHGARTALHGAATALAKHGEIELAARIMKVVKTPVKADL